MPSVALVGPEFEENLSLRYLASSLRAGDITTEILAFNRERDLPGIVAQILAAPPTVVGLSLAFQWRAKDFLALALALRDAGYRGHITAGGHFATFASRELLRDFPELDSICRQESEHTLVELTRRIADAEDWRDIPGLAFRDAAGEPQLTEQPALPDLAKLPRPDRSGDPATCFGHAIAPLVGSRGCYANCTFCCIAAWHEESQPGKRYRLRTPEDIADEMVEMQRERNIEIFVFHDDNFFVPGHKKNAERFRAIADALEARGMGRFATVVKARPTDVDREVFRVLKERLHCIRVYVGIETDADQGLITLGRWSAPQKNHRAIELVRELDLYTCFNMLLFDPDTTLESLATNFAFIRKAADFPFNFGRVELYAGTPLLGRMQLEERCWGDYMQWDYALASPEVERMFSLAMRCFHARNFGEGALANRLMGTRFDIEVARFFHKDGFDPRWLDEGRVLSRTLALDSVDALERILEHVRTTRDGDDALVEEIAAGLRRVEAQVSRRASGLAREIHESIGGGLPLTDIGDRVATPLQTQRLEVG
jgi:anaerobic magnesium-protoporphyrin IX monomethyl ester cyclase